jgi:hypothetical protein
VAASWPAALWTTLLGHGGSKESGTKLVLLRPAKVAQHQSRDLHAPALLVAHASPRRVRWNFCGGVKVKHSVRQLSPRRVISL